MLKHNATLARVETVANGNVIEGKSCQLTEQMRDQWYYGQIVTPWMVLWRLGLSWQATALGPAAVPLPKLPSAMPVFVGRRMTLRRLNLAKAIPTRACCHPSSEVLPLPMTDKPTQ